MCLMTMERTRSEASKDLEVSKRHSWLFVLLGASKSKALFQIAHGLWRNSTPPESFLLYMYGRENMDARYRDATVHREVARVFDSL